MSGSRATPLHAIDAVRFACALLVVGYHYGAALPLEPAARALSDASGAVVPANWAGASWFGWVGVEVFFVVSGFVIAISAAESSRRDFARRRVLRLAPAAWICATLTLIALIAVGRGNPAGWLRSVGFWPWGSYIDPVYWTLGVEIGFYSVVAICMGPVGTAVRIERAAVAAGAVSALFWANVILGNVDPVVPRWAQLLLVQHGCFFALGVLVWAILDRGLTPLRMVVAAVMGATCLIEVAGHASGHARALGIVSGPTLPLAIFVVAVAILFGARRFEPLVGRWGPMLGTLGLMTYPLYLVHQLAGYVVIGALMRAGVGADAARVAALGLALAVALWIVRYAEPAMRRSLSTLLMRGAGLPQRQHSAALR